MKFLITGKLNEARGPRRITTLAIVFFAFFILAHIFREINAYGITPEEIAASFHGQAGEPAARSWKVLLEEIHIDSILYALVLLFLDSVLYQTPPPRTARRLANAAWISALGFLSAKAAAFFTPVAVYPLLILGTALHCLLAAMIVRILRFLYFAK